MAFGGLLFSSIDRQPSTAVADFIIGSSFTKSEHTVINIGEPDGPPKLVSRFRERSPNRMTINLPLCRLLALDLRKALTGIQVCQVIVGTR